ncbi:MAG: hypothetical protein ACTHM7_05860 [Ginsengibacter sp.]
MLAFVVPIKSKAVCKDWDYELKLLERTARSICNQTNRYFKMIIVHNEKPKINFNHENIIYVDFPYPFVTADKIEDFDSYVQKYYNKEYSEKMLDKGKKISFGCKIAQQYNCSYIMAVDSDDLVSNKLAEYVNQQGSDNAGWRIRKGFVYEEGNFHVTKNKRIFGINGSTHIISSKIITIPDFERNIFWNFNLFEAHGYTRQRLKDYNKVELQEIDFYGIIYVVHKNNYSNIRKITSDLTLKNVVKKIIRGKLITKELSLEFGLYKIR